MADAVRYLDFDGLAHYDELIKNYIRTEGGGTIGLSVSSSTTDGYLKTYELTQNGALVGKIDIPKDFVVTSGEVVTLASGDVPGIAAGTYIKMIISGEPDPLYISVSELANNYRAQASATQVQLSVVGNEISATLVNSGVNTAHIADKSVTSNKLSEGLQETLNTLEKIKDGMSISDLEIEGLFAVGS